MKGTADPTATMSHPMPAIGRDTRAGTAADTPRAGGAVAKYHSRPSAQYRYEHYDPTSPA